MTACSSRIVGPVHPQFVWEFDLYPSSIGRASGVRRPVQLSVCHTRSRGRAFTHDCMIVTVGSNTSRCHGRAFMRSCHVRNGCVWCRPQRSPCAAVGATPWSCDSSPGLGKYGIPGIRMKAPWSHLHETVDPIESHACNPVKSPIQSLSAGGLGHVRRTPPSPVLPGREAPAHSPGFGTRLQSHRLRIHAHTLPIHGPAVTLRSTVATERAVTLRGGAVGAAQPRPPRPATVPDGVSGNPVPTVCHENAPSRCFCSV
jgi:hypothetical protein